MSFKKVLIAIDSEPVAFRAAETGVDLAASLGAEVAFIHVMDVSLLYPADTGPAPNELVCAAKLDAKRLVATIRQCVALQPSLLEFFQVGRPADEIVKAAEEWSADLFVIGSLVAAECSGRFSVAWPKR
jgi:nucleotide-binding universal stress UspA family protein